VVEVDRPAQRPSGASLPRPVVEQRARNVSGTPTVTGSSQYVRCGSRSPQRQLRSIVHIEPGEQRHVGAGHGHCRGGRASRVAAAAGPAVRLPASAKREEIQHEQRPVVLPAHRRQYRRGTRRPARSPPGRPARPSGGGGGALRASAAMAPESTLTMPAGTLYRQGGDEQRSAVRHVDAEDGQCQHARLASPRIG